MLALRRCGLEVSRFCIGLKLIEVKARISARSGGISFYIGLKHYTKKRSKGLEDLFLHRSQQQGSNTGEARAAARLIREENK